MYPQAEVNGARRDSLDPDSFRYKLTAKELVAPEGGGSAPEGQARAERLRKATSFCCSSGGSLVSRSRRAASTVPLYVFTNATHGGQPFEMPVEELGLILREGAVHVVGQEVHALPALHVARRLMRHPLSP